MKLNLGCGGQKIDGYIGIDNGTQDFYGNGFTPDVTHDLNTGIPYPDNSVDAVYTSHFLEHVKNPYFMMDEIYRVCKYGSEVMIIVPVHCDWLEDHLTCFYPRWFERNVDPYKFRIIEKTVETKPLIPAQGEHNEFTEMRIKLEVTKC